MVNQEKLAVQKLSGQYSEELLPHLGLRSPAYSS